MKSRRHLIGLGNRCEIKLIIPSQSALDVAAERTEGMVEYFQAASRSSNYIGFTDYLERLVRSAYLQGVEDAAVAMAMLEKTGGVR